MKPENLSEHEQLEFYNKCKGSFKFFMVNVASESYEHFIHGDHVDITADFLQAHKRTMRISAKDHFKSTSLYLHWMWKMFVYPLRDLEAHYFSFETKMSAYHLAKIKELIARNPWFVDARDLKETAESILKYTWDGEHIHRLNPQSMLKFKRGLHCDIVYVDDPFQDPANKLNPTIVNKINYIFTTQIMDIPKQDGELHGVGTPQTEHDFFFDKNLMSRFNVLQLPAIVSEKKRTVLWKEHMNFEELMQRRNERGRKVFDQEYMCRPFYSENTWLDREVIKKLIDPDLKQPFFLKTNNYVSLGWDIGKKVHPSHIVIFEFVDGMWIQRYQEFLDGWDYKVQLEHVHDLIRRYSVDSGYYDSTRGELEAFKEQKLISPILKEVNFKSRVKMEMATLLDSIITEKKIRFIDHQRYINQMLVVDDNLNALETPEGHGESFWSTALAMRAHKLASRKRTTKAPAIGYHVHPILKARR